MQVSKIIKNLIKIFFNNFNLRLMHKYLGYKNINKIKLLLIKLSYNKILL